jgi:(S)-2-hydroxyglutarate dehydrogenase
MHVDYLVIGGGIIGISTAWQLLQKLPHANVLVVEKAGELACHQSGHNSGVIHAGVYYAPGSLKARFCQQGSKATYAFCQQEDIPVERCGKLLVASDAQEMQWMSALYARTLENGIRVEHWDQERLQQAEPNIRGLGALWIPDTGIVDYRQVTRKMAVRFEALGGGVKTATEVIDIHESADSVLVQTSDGSINAGRVICCGGLMADRLVKQQGLEPDFRILPFRGEYYKLPDDKNTIINRLIYPVPNPALPFLGVHLTRMIDGSITVGPNAVLGLKRESYNKSDISVTDLVDMLRFPGFWRLISSNLRTGLQEFRDSVFKRGYLRRVQKYCPMLELDDLRPSPSGVRAQAVSRKGELIHDFLFVKTPRTLHVCNAPSPAATSAIPIGAHIIDQIT